MKNKYNLYEGWKTQMILWATLETHYNLTGHIGTKLYVILHFDKKKSFGL